MGLRPYLRGLVDSVRPVWKLRAERLWEIDALRGIAICMMVVYHLMWDLKDLGGYDIAIRSGFWLLFQIATAGLFTILVGVSLTLSFNRAKAAGRADSLWPKFVTRGAVIFTWGMAISMVTLALYGPDRMVRFGILHLIGLSIPLAYPLLRFRWLNLGLAVALIVAGWAIRGVRPDLPWLEWLAPTPGHGVDYAPLVPMFSRILIGVFIGNMLYPGGVRRFGTPAWGDNPLIRVLRGMGQNSLLIYVVHQPLLIAILFLIGVTEW